MVFYTEGEDLYRFDVESETREALTSGATGPSGIWGSQLKTAPMRTLSPPRCWRTNENGNQEKAQAGKANLYEWHDGETRFIAQLEQEGNTMEYDWRDFYSNTNFGAVPATGEKRARSLLMARRCCLLRKRS